MLDWLLKEEEKAKVGRPKLARVETLRKAEITLIISLVICFSLAFFLFCYIKGEEPLVFAYNITKSKLLASVTNKSGFEVNKKYKNDKYIIDIKPLDVVRSYSGKYKYTLYKLNKNKWKEIETNTYENKKDNFKISIDRKRNKNVTYKIKLELVNSALVTKSYAPTGWTFVDTKKKNDVYAYNIFTVQGYYSPISNDEYKEVKKKENKVNIYTKAENPREFFIDNKGVKYNISVSYTDLTGKEELLKKESDLTEISSFVVPSMNKITTVKIKIWLPDTEYQDLSKLKLSNWKKKKDKDGKYYIYNSYLLKPDESYR